MSAHSSAKAANRRKMLLVLLSGVSLLAVIIWRKDQLLAAGVNTGLLPASWGSALSASAAGNLPGAVGGLEAESNGPGGKGAANAGGAGSVFSPRGVPGKSGKPSAGDASGRLRVAGKSGEEMRDWAAKVTALKGKASLKPELESFIGNITGDNWREVVEASLPLYDFLDPEQWVNLMIHIGAVGGQAAAERFKPANPLLESESYGARNIVRGWARVDPAAAQAFVQSLPEGLYRDGMGVGFLRGIDEASVASLEKMYDQLPHDMWSQIAAAQRDMARWEAAGPDSGVQGWVDRTEAQFGKNSERFRVVQETADLHWLDAAMWAKDSAKVTALTQDYLDRPGKETTDRVLITALTNVGQSDPAAALELAGQNLTARPALTQSVPVIVSNWAGRDPGAPGDWLNANTTSPLHDPATAAYAKSIQKDNPAAAMAWAEIIQSGTLRSATLKQLAKQQGRQLVK